MSKFHKVGWIVLLLVFLGVQPAFSAHSAFSPILGQGVLTGIGNISVIRVNISGKIDAVGTLHMKMILKFPTVSMYVMAKRIYPSPYVMLRNLLIQNADTIVKNADVKYRDSDRSVVMDADVVGQVVNKQGVWEFYVGREADLIWRTDKLAIFAMISYSRGSAVVSYLKIELPDKAYDVAYDTTDKVLTYSMPKEKVPSQIVTSVRTKLTVKPRIMSATYKIYGDPEFHNGYYWVARAEITNTGNSNIYNLTITYKMEGYCDWSESHTYHVVVPGETVVDLYYPVIPSKVTKLMTRTPTMVEMKYTYKDERGRLHTAYKHKRLHILGISQFEFSNIPVEERTGSWMDDYSNAPLLAAWVTRLDPVVKKFAGMASQLAGGVATSQRNKDAIRFCKALYDLMVDNKIVYQTPSASFLTEYSYEQDVKYPRDTLRDKAGTCVDLSILYAAVCEAEGLRTLLVLLPGHMFPIVSLPEGGYLPVEISAISGTGGSKPSAKSPSFAEIVRLAQRDMRRLREGLYYLVDVEELWRQGVVSPELPPLEANVLQRWGYKVVSPKKGETKGGVQKNIVGVTGVWHGVGRNSAGGASRILMKLRQVGNNITGNCVLTPGGNGTVRGIVQGSRIKLVVDFVGVNGRFQVVFEGTVKGNVIAGRWYSPGSAVTGTFSLQRG